MSMKAEGILAEDRYEVIELLGAGGTARVYRARDTLLDRDVALKQLNDRFAGDPDFVGRFKREARAAAQLSHPNVIALYDYGSDASGYFIVMELVEGTTLQEVIDRDGPLLPVHAAEIAARIAGALVCAHNAGLVHRDITSSNIMLTPSGDVKVADFGIATALSDDERTTAGAGVMGTAGYLSPERVNGQEVDGRTDVYSLGVVLYEMVTGRLPFDGQSPLEVATQHVFARPAPPSDFSERVPADLDTIVLRMLAKDPEERYSSAGALQADLDRFIGGRQVRATRVLAEPVRAPRSRRRPILAALGALTLVGLFLLAGWLVLDARTRPDPLPQLTGRYLPDARQRLASYDVRVQVDRRYSEAPLDYVLEQKPAAGSDVLPGETVYLVVSNGPEPGFGERFVDGVENVIDRAEKSLDETIDSILGDTNR
jgi:hypothetical protein